MNKTNKTAVLFAAIAIAAVPVSAQNDDLWIYKTKYVIDTVVADSIEAAKNAEYNAKNRDYYFQEYAKSYLWKIAIYDKLIAAEKNDQPLDPTSREDSEPYVQLTMLGNMEGVTKKDLKAIRKHKVPKGFSEKILIPAKAALQEKIDQFVPPAEKREYDWRRRRGYGNVPEKAIQVPIPNPDCRDNYFNGQCKPSYYNYREHKWDKAQQSTGWEWAERDNMVSKSISYPEKLSWFEHPDHPEYRFVEMRLLSDRRYLYNAYDENGKLVRIDNIYGRLNYSSIKESVMTAICKRDFLANKYDINNAGENTLNALRSKLGVEKTEKQKKAEAAINKGLSDAIVKGETAKYDKKQAVTKKEREKAAKEERDAVNAGAAYMLMALASSMDEQANNYIEQLKSDHSNDLRYIYKIERIDNTTFKVYFLNDKFECGCIALMKWYNKGAYDADYEIELLPCETITIRR